MSHGPIEKKLVDRMNLLALQLDDIFNPMKPRTVGFVLLAFPFDGNDGRMNYISNADRKDIIVALKELVANFEGRTQPAPDKRQ